MSKRFFFAVIFIFLGMSVASASCGLQGCPVERPGQKKLLVDGSLRYATFNVEHVSGHYWQVEPRLEYYGVSRWIFGGFGSLVKVDTGHESDTGLGNPVVFAEYAVREGRRACLSVGSQFEASVGDDDKGVAADHDALLPYVSLNVESGLANWHGSFGYQYAISDGGHGGHHTPLLVNPHEDEELLYRFGAAKKFQETKWGFSVNGQHAMDGETKGTGFLSVSGSYDYILSKASSVGVILELPATSPRRFDSRAEFHASVHF